jgi:hypothetical protein
MENFNIRGIPPEMCSDLWRFAEPYIRRALDHTYGELTSLDLKNLCASKDAQLWMVQKGDRIIGAGTTMIMNYPQMKVCRIITLSGSEFKEWKNLACMHIEMWADANGCEGVEAYVRRGFVPQLLEIGFKYRYAVVHKSLKG